MSAGVLRRAAWLGIADISGGAPLKRALWSVTKECHDDQLQFIYDAGADAGLDPNAICARGTAATFLASAIQLADDLSDGEADYLPNASLDGPVVLMLLDQLFLTYALRAETPQHVLVRCSQALMSVGIGQHIELRTRRWTRCRAGHVAQTLNGAQQTAYLELMWWGTALAGSCSSVGGDLGFAIHVATDARTADLRFHSLSVADKHSLIEDVSERCRRLSRQNIPCVSRIARAVRDSLKTVAVPDESA